MKPAITEQMATIDEELASTNLRVAMVATALRQAWLPDETIWMPLGEERLTIGGKRVLVSVSFDSAIMSDRYKDTLLRLGMEYLFDGSYHWILFE